MVRERDSCCPVVACVVDRDTPGSPGYRYCAFTCISLIWQFVVPGGGGRAAIYTGFPVASATIAPAYTRSLPEEAEAIPRKVHWVAASGLHGAGQGCCVAGGVGTKVTEMFPAESEITLCTVP
jgi:hypothetical protein